MDAKVELFGRNRPTLSHVNILRSRTTSHNSADDLRKDRFDTSPMIHQTEPLMNTPTSSFHLSAEQIEAFDRDGFLVLRKRLTGSLLRQLQAAANGWVDQAIAHGHETNGTNNADFMFAKRPGDVRVPFRVNYLHGRGDPASLIALGSPEILGIAESLAGPNFVPTYESMVFKMPGDGAIIDWHQDAVFQERRHRIFNIDIYLDPAGRDTGALRVIPRSQTFIHNVCAMNDGTYDWANGPHEVVDMEPGDVLIHDDMVLHGSPRTQNNPMRRVVYFEFRPADQIIKEGPWDRTFVDQRLRLVPLAMRRFTEAFPERDGFKWQADLALRPTVSTDETAELRVVHTVHTPGSYCSADSVSGGMVK